MPARSPRRAVYAQSIFLLFLALATPARGQGTADPNEAHDKPAAAAPEPARPAAPAEDHKTVNPLALTPARLTEPEATFNLPAAFDSVRVGGGGRFLVFHFKSLGKLAVFDVCNLKIAGYVATKRDDDVYAASASQLLLVHPETATLESYSLETLKLQTTRTLPIRGKINVVAVGAASEGPLLVSPLGDDQQGPDTVLLDLETLKPLDDKWRHFASAAWGQVSHARAAARGNVFAWDSRDRAGLRGQILFCEGLNVTACLCDSGGQSGDIYPDECGTRIFLSGKMADRQLHPLESLPGEEPRGYLVPAVQGPLYVCLPCDYHRPPAKTPVASTITVLLPGESSALATFADVPFRPYNGGDYVRYKALSVADQVFLIPGAQVLAVVPETKDRLVLRRFDLDQALKSWDKDYLFVMSAPPRYVRAGDILHYQLDVKSNKPPVKYRLDSGPEGMTLSSAGLVRWPVGPVAEGATSVVISVEDGSGKSVFHSFDLVVRGDGRAAPVEIAVPRKATEAQAATGAAARAAPPATPLVTPTKLAQEEATFPLPAAAAGARMGGCGRYLVLHLPSLAKLAVFDLCEAKIAGYVPAGSDALFAAGAEHVFVLDPAKGLLQRFPFATLKADAAKRLTMRSRPTGMALGSASQGPLLVGCGYSSSPEGLGTFLVDVKTLDRIDEAARNMSRAVMAQRSNRARLKDQRDADQSKTIVPAVDGPFYFQLPGMLGPTEPRREPTAILFSNDQAEPLAELPGLPRRFMYFSPNGDATMYGGDVFYVPKAQVIAMLANPREAVVLRKFDVEEELAKAGKNYLFVMSSPPGIVRVGDTLRYQLDVRSKAGGVTCKLAAGPAGMTVSDTGLVSWTAKAQGGSGAAHCDVAVSDAKHAAIHHAFDLDIDDSAVGENAAAPAGVRTFHDISGKKLDAVFQSLAAGKVQLQRKDNGSTVVVPLAQLSIEDQQWVWEHASPPAAPAAASQTSPWIGESLAFLAEARQCLAKADLPDEPTTLPREIDALERDLQLLVNVKQNGLEPLHVRLRNSRIYGEPLEWVRKLCAADMPALAEQLAKEAAAGPANVPLPPITYVARHYLAHGNRAEGIRVLTEAAASSPMVLFDNAGGVAPGPLMLLAFPERGSVDDAIAVSKGLKDPFMRASAFLAVAGRCAEGGDRNKAQEVLREAEKMVETAAASLSADARSSALVIPYLRLERAYRDFDVKKSAQYADRALEAAGKLRDRLVADSAARNAAGTSGGASAGEGPQGAGTMDALRQLASGFYNVGDRERGRAAFRLLLDASTKGVPAEEAYEAARSVAMSAARVGEYAAAAAILRDIQDDPVKDLCDCTRDSKTPATAAEAREFVAAFRNLPPGDDRSKMVLALVMVGELDAARKLAATANDPVYHSGLIAGELAAENKMSEAEKDLQRHFPWPFGDGSAENNTSDAVKVMQRDSERRVRAIARERTADALLARSSPDGALPPGTRGESDVDAREALAYIKAGRIDDAVRIGADSGARAAIVQELCRLDRWNDALKMVADGKEPGMTPDLILAMCRNGQVDAALAAMKSSQPGPPYAHPAKLTETWAAHDDPQTVAAWARKLESSEDCCAALLGVARAILIKHEP